MHRKQLAYIALAAGTAWGLASVQLTAHPSAREQRGWASWYGPGVCGPADGERRALLAAGPDGRPSLVTLGDTGAGDAPRDRPAGGGHDQ
jgi:hypothetical protein